MNSINETRQSTNVAASTSLPPNALALERVSSSQMEKLDIEKKISLALKSPSPELS